MTHKHSPKAALGAALFAAALPFEAALAGPTIEHWIADTGARVYFVESRALPLIDLRVDFAAGSAYDPPERSGLANMTRGLLDTGVEGLDEQQIAEQIADTGAQIGGSVDNDRAGLSVRTLSSERDAALALAARLLAQPAFPAVALERERARSIAGLREALTRPATLAARAFGSAIYGSHPYGRESTIESLEAITRDDLVAFHRQHYTAANASVTIVGDASREEAARIAVELTRALPAGDAPAVELAQPMLPARSVVRIPHPSAQAHVLVGMPGMAREDPDYYTLLVGNYILGGGGFVSRLTREVREQRGFAYSVYSYFQPQRVAGPFQIGLQTRGSQAEPALRVVEDVLADFIAQGPTAEELQAAKDNIINGFGLRLDSNRKILDHVAMIGFYGLPLDWLDAYPGHIEAATTEAVRDAFARRIRPEHLVTVIAGGDGDAPGAEGASNGAPAPQGPAN